MYMYMTYMYMYIIVGAIVCCRWGHWFTPAAWETCLRLWLGNLFTPAAWDTCLRLWLGTLVYACGWRHRFTRVVTCPLIAFAHCARLVFSRQ